MRSRHLDKAASCKRQAFEAKGELRSPLTAEQQASLKVQCIMQLANIGAASKRDVVALSLGTLDDVLDRMFLHCGMLRVRFTDTDYVEIRPGGMTLQ